MDIILIRRRGGQARRFYFNPGILNFWAPIAFVLLSAATGLVWAGYHFAPRPDPDQATVQSLAKAWRVGVAQDRQQLTDMRKTVGDNVDAMTQRLGDLQAHVMRLDALGRHLVNAAGLDKKEFDFGHPLGLGGPDTGDLGPAARTPTLDAAMNSFARTLDQRESELEVLQSVIMHKHLQRQERPSGRPVKHSWISSVFGMRTDPFTGKLSFHPGIDFASQRGAAVRAVASGIVTWAGRRGGYGNLVQINDGNGYVTRYGHNEKILVHVGQRVHKGQEISLLGSTGRSTGPHVHFEVRYKGRPINPARFVEASR